MHVEPRCAAAVATLVLSACGHVPLSTMVRMRGFDPGTVDPIVLRAAIRIPDSLRPQPGGLRLVVRHRLDGDEVKERELEIVLQETTEATETAPLASEAGPGMRLHVFRANPSDVERLRTEQAEMAAARRRGGTRPRGSLSVQADVCRAGKLPAGPLRLTTYLKTEERGGFIVLVEDVDLRTLVPKGETIERRTPPCSELDGPRR